MFRFSTMQEAAGAFETINRDYEKQCRAARRIAETLFDARQIMGEILSHGLCATKSLLAVLQSAGAMDWA
jgi:hypothetical protein